MSKDYGSESSWEDTFGPIILVRAFEIKHFIIQTPCNNVYMTLYKMVTLLKHTRLWLKAFIYVMERTLEEKCIFVNDIVIIKIKRNFFWEIFWNMFLCQVAGSFRSVDF